MALFRDFLRRPYSNLALSGAFAALSFPVIARLLFDYLIGGTGWRQGDWLINFHAGPVRRGGLGEAIILLSDLMPLSLLATIILIQSGLFILLVFVLWQIALRHENRPLVLLLAASSAFFPIFWASDVQGIVRKELLGYLAFSLLALSTVLGGKHPGLAIIAVLLFFIGCMGNIIHSLLGVAMFAALWLAKEGGQISDYLFRVLAGLTVVTSLFWLGFAVTFPAVENLTLICEPLLSRDLHDNICQGAIKWLIPAEIDHQSQVQIRMTFSALTQYGLVGGVALIPVCLCFFIFREQRILALLAAFTFLPMLPLYAVATDWGRWLSISYTSFVLLVILAHGAGRLSLIRLPPTPLTVVLLSGALLMSHEHSIGWQPGGAVKSIYLTVIDFR